MKPGVRASRRVVELITRLAPRSIFPGEWESIVPGEGFDFHQIRPYRHGEDPRRIHLPSLFREGKKRIVDRVAQRQVSIYIYADFSRSMGRNEELNFFSKAEIRDVLISLISRSAAKVYSPLSLCVAGGEVKSVLSPVIGDDNAQRIMRWSLEQESLEGKVDMKSMLAHIMRHTRRWSIVFIISDFLGELNFATDLKRANQMRDIVPLVVLSDQEQRMLSVSSSPRFSFQDAESGDIVEVRLDGAQLAQMREARDRHIEGLGNIFRGARVDWAVIDSPESCFPRLQRIFARRHHR